MRRYSPPYHSPPRRGYGGRPRSPPRRVYEGERGRHKEENHGSLLVRNIPLNCREPRGFAFVQFVDAYDAAEAQYHMNGRMFAGREISVVLAAETRKRPEEMRRRTRVRGPSGSDGRRSYHGRSRSQSRSRSRSPRRPLGSRSRHRSRSYSPAPKRRSDYSQSPVKREPRSPLVGREIDDVRRSYSPGYGAAADQNVDRRSPSPYEGGAGYKSSASRSPPGSRSRSAADISPPPRD
ncbi:Nucleotide-binding, alpha-beta plait [Cynara cardunculus var. scolymus]|uniref:Nucleotide-binding, alpha-beta plait n=1 Tax=Cynara cardunculus var. scolymus TaxID=59895 RepID=A0A124SHJ9_CYNCS|nr:Nucleotide-binding, alpha-beta plait [Cynara cardunculus var. scolymus]